MLLPWLSYPSALLPTLPNDTQVVYDWNITEENLISLSGTYVLPPALEDLDLVVYDWDIVEDEAPSLGGTYVIPPVIVSLEED